MAKYVGRKGPEIITPFRKWVYEVSGFNQYGLFHNDCMSEELCPDVREAVRRLPRDLYNERNFRVIRALHLSMCKLVLPKEEWTRYEEDHRYLEPYLNEVIKERKERQEWNKKY